MTKSTLIYTAAGATAASGAGVGGYMYATRETISKEQKKKSISETLTEAGKKVLSTVAGSSNPDEEEWKKRQKAYGTATNEELITDVGASGGESTLNKSESVDIEKMKKWCQKYADSEFTVAADATYRKVLKWCTREAQ
ncbi:hypothetical protein HF1_09280 [Mycoplasma haemofelis str. Langford 1]|uniref:Uncharacterized protein n=1 Tax=Mycoplasma haemofelis (strain Langford 1) TaxID=941640 RepID=E8ZIG5_MYCHL|nr:hypothetical protein [Mycoplasma haemofelis]CBY92936.1 hypothetical protein HF1_09280 [Mycoplasma haemofelis str. Langford 1]